MGTDREKARIDMTLGNLVVALSDAAFELCEDEKRAYLIASLALSEILKTGQCGLTKWRRIQMRVSQERGSCTRTMIGPRENDEQGIAMPRKLSLVLLAFCAAAILSSPAIAAEAGKAVYEKNCASCHGPDGKGNPAMTKVFGEKALNIATKEVREKKDDELSKVVTEGKGKMPAAGKALSKSDQKAVLEHVRSLGK